MILSNGEVERCSPLGSSGCPDLSTVFLNDALHRGEADTVAGELGFRMQTLERLEQTAGTSRVEAGSVVAHEIDG